ncbi:uncharacterized protein LOC106083718 isoform X2 [Stomoxys calcitrans]|uniref:uncharacterized protein LOC106083718 isoform X2 n=1 Tax=Stomoxys calcitrans TaxID=35570 RepID=UPI0027E3A22B|nr:uncharacterized protein LOC106083718 isoform X2 [Stomoxys calcitrans]
MLNNGPSSSTGHVVYRNAMSGLQRESGNSSNEHRAENYPYGSFYNMPRDNANTYGNRGFCYQTANGDFSNSKRFENNNNTISYPTYGRFSYGHNKSVVNHGACNRASVGKKSEGLTLLGKRRFASNEQDCFEESYQSQSRRYTGFNDAFHYMMGKGNFGLPTNRSTESDDKSSDNSQCRDGRNEMFGNLKDDYGRQSFYMRNNYNSNKHIEGSNRNNDVSVCAKDEASTGNHNITKPKAWDKHENSDDEPDEGDVGKDIDEADNVVIPSPFKRNFDALDWKYVIKKRVGKHSGRSRKEITDLLKKYPPGPTKKDPENYWRDWWKSYAYIENTIENVERRDKDIRYKLQFQCDVGKTWHQCARTVYDMVQFCKRRMRRITEELLENETQYKVFKYRTILRDVYLNYRPYMSVRRNRLLRKVLYNLNNRVKFALILQSILMTWHRWKNMINKFERAEISLSDEVTYAYSMLNNKLYNFIVYESLLELKNICSDDWPGFNEYYKRLQY